MDAEVRWGPDFAQLRWTREASLPSREKAKLLSSRYSVYATHYSLLLTFYLLLNYSAIIVLPKNTVPKLFPRGEARSTHDAGRRTHDVSGYPVHQVHFPTKD